jgi:HSP20 family protein
MRPFIPIGRNRDTARREFHPFTSLQREIARVFDDFTRGFPTFGSQDLTPSMDVIETDKEIEVTAELPGLEEKDVEINLSDNVLTIRGEKRAEKEEKDKDKNYRVVERSYGSFYRSLELPAGIDPDQIKATISKGVLKVSVPKPPTQVKKIAVSSAA